MIRRGLSTDRAAVVALLRDFHAAAALPFEFSAPWAAALFEAHCTQPDRAAFVLDDGGARGVLLAVAGQSPLGSFRIAQELAWWVDPAHRGGGGAMLDAYEEWAAEHGCTLVGTAALASMPRAEGIYLHRGYTRAETHFLKAL